MTHQNDISQEVRNQPEPSKPDEAETANQAKTTPFKIQDDELIILPVRDFVLFPGTVFPVTIGRPQSVLAAQQALREEKPIGVLMQLNPETAAPAAVDMHRMGTIATILRYINTPDGNHHLVLQAEQRFSVDKFIRETPFFVVKATRIEQIDVETPQIEAHTLHLRQLALEALQLLPQVPQEMLEALRSAASASALADLVAAYLDIKPDEKQDLLETIAIGPRIEKVARFLRERVEVMRLSQEIGRQAKASLDERQREVILREQMAAIQRQLGEDSGRTQETAELTEAIAKAKMPPEVEEVARKELSRYERMPEGATEAGMVRSYLDWLIELPWALPESREIDINQARKILDEDHFGLEKIKRRIVEFLAVRKLAPEGKAPILCFVGAPGVGKTSLGQSIAHAMGRPLARVSLGGVHDEAEIRGHRRTYIGALPGNIIQAIRKTKSRDCVMVLDEIDKMGASMQGDPAAAMLEVLDPEQNSTFRDNYLAVPFDLSHVVFIATANMLESIPGALRDRMEVIGLSGYMQSEKLQIARRYLVPRQLAANGLKPEQLDISDEVLNHIIADYTREAGVRNLEREIGRTFRNAAVRIAEGSTQHVTITPDELIEILGQPRFENEVAMRTSVPGVATGLAWTPVGGDILFIEATLIPGKGNLILTGQLGEVMRESTQAALSIVKNRATSLGIDPSVFEHNDIHVHVPAGATPKDGPSAGVAMYTALVSLLKRRTVRSDTAMTGEISLRGLVLPVGGIREKVVAAAAAGITRVMLPARNRRDFDDIPEDARNRLEFIWLEKVDDAIAAGLDAAEVVSS